MLGVIGGLLDFASATSLLLDRAEQLGMMSVGAPYIMLSLGLYILGVLVIVTSLFSAMLVGMRHPGLFSALMIIYGAAMVVVGWVMSTDMVSAVVSSLYSYGMIVLGALMLINALLMLRSHVEMQRSV